MEAEEGNEETKCDQTNGQAGNALRNAISSFLLVALGVALLLLMVHGQITVTRTAVAAVGFLWVASLGSGAVFEALGIPALLGSLVAGLVLRNAGGDRFETSDGFRELIEAVGLSVILLLSALEIDVRAVYSAGWIPLRLTCIPGLTEASVAAGVAHLVFDMPLALAFTLGFVLAAVSPAIVVPGLMALQREGHGESVASLLFASCAFDDVVAILGFSVSLGVALKSDSNVLLSAFMLGPVSIFFGVVAGCVGGSVLALLCKLSPNRWQRTVIAIELVLLLAYGFDRLSFAAGSAVGTMIIGIVAKYLLGGALADGDECEHDDCVATLEADINTVW